jgi:hypothetical protein
MSEAEVTSNMDLADTQLNQNLFGEFVGLHQREAASERKPEQNMNTEVSQQVVSLSRCLEQRWGVS